MEKNIENPRQQLPKAAPQDKKDKLARALRDNLRRRKAPSPAVKDERDE